MVAWLAWVSFELLILFDGSAAVAAAVWALPSDLASLLDLVSESALTN